MRHASKRAIRASIHASAREATWDHGSGAGLFCQFQSTPPHGRRPMALVYQGAEHKFQSTPPHGRRLFAAAFASFAQGVSIHASAREATCPCRSPQRRPGCFNPRLRTGGDPTFLVDPSADRRFQSTPPHGRRPAMRRSRSARREEFQSTPPHGRRPRVEWEHAVPAEFQSTPPHGRRPAATGIAARAQRVSIHASAREATFGMAALLTQIIGFNPRLRTGGDKTQEDNRQEEGRFQSTPPHGRRR